MNFTQNLNGNGIFIVDIQITRSKSLFEKVTHFDGGFGYKSKGKAIGASSDQFF